jgi:hypothetical protein
MSVEKLFPALPPKQYPRRPERQFVAVQFVHSAVFNSVVSTGVDATGIVYLR